MPNAPHCGPLQDAESEIRVVSDPKLKIHWQSLSKTYFNHVKGMMECQSGSPEVHSENNEEIVILSAL